MIAHNAKTLDLHFILNRDILLKWKVELIMNGKKIMCLQTEHLFPTVSLRKLTEEFGLTASKYWYPHSFNTQANLNYVRNNPRRIILRKSSSLGTKVSKTSSSTTDDSWQCTVRIT